MTRTSHTERDPSGPTASAGAAGRGRGALGGAVLLGIAVAAVAGIVLVACSGSSGDDDAGSAIDDLWGWRWRVVDLDVVDDFDDPSDADGDADAEADGDADGDAAGSAGAPDDEVSPTVPGTEGEPRHEEGPPDPDGDESPAEPDDVDPSEADVADLPVDGSITVEFGEDRDVRYAGCNGGFGRASVEDDRLVAREMASTMMACLGGDGPVLMAWDTWFGRFLAEGVRVEVDGERRILVGDAGSVVLERDREVEERDPVEDPDAPVSNESESSPADGD